MTDKLIKIAPDFWNIRGSFRIGGVVNIGTHSSLVKRASGKYLLLDAYTLKGRVKRKILAETDNGAAIEAVLNLHPFHTIHCEAVHKLLPHAALYGTARHIEKWPDLPWQPDLLELPDTQAQFAEDLEFSIPDGVDFISDNERIHFSSILAYHPASKTMHVDDTFMCLKLPLPVGGGLSLHPTLAAALEKRAGAADEFRAWADAIGTRWAEAQTLCTAHNSNLAFGSGKTGFQPRLAAAVDKTRAKLDSHAKKYG